MNHENMLRKQLLQYEEIITILLQYAELLTLV
jgi:hypothetical protein